MDRHATVITAMVGHGAKARFPDVIPLEMDF
jgi:hypothetical protein